MKVEGLGMRFEGEYAMDFVAKYIEDYYCGFGYKVPADIGLVADLTDEKTGMQNTAILVIGSDYKILEWRNCIFEYTEEDDAIILNGFCSLDDISVSGKGENAEISSYGKENK